MTETLTTRIKKWIDAKRHCEGITGIVARSKKKLQQFSIERRLMSSLDIANGVAYLHSKNIIFRDLVSSGLFFMSMPLELLTKIYGWINRNQTMLAMMVTMSWNSSTSGWQRNWKRKKDQGTVCTNWPASPVRLGTWRQKLVWENRITYQLMLTVGQWSHGSFWRWNHHLLRAHKKWWWNAFSKRGRGPSFSMPGRRRSQTSCRWPGAKRSPIDLTLILFVAL